MNRRFMILDKFNSWYDWRCTLTAKDHPAPEPKTNYLSMDGANGDKDLSESLTGEPVYNNRTVTASFMCSEGTYKDREALLREIRTGLHGRKVKIIEPDDPDHYFLGRVKVKDEVKQSSYMTFGIEATCDPWRYAVNVTTRAVAVEGGSVDVVFHNHGDKTLCPLLTVTGSVVISFNGGTTELTAGSYKVTDLRLPHGASVVGVSGTGTVLFTYREAML